MDSKEAEDVLEGYHSIQVREAKAGEEGWVRCRWELNRSVSCKPKEACVGLSREVEVGCELPDSVLSVHFLQFHSAVLEPDFDLSVRQVDRAADF